MYVKVADTFLDHRKLRKLESVTGLPRVVLRGHLLTLWLNMLRHRPDGRLDDWDHEDISYYSEFPAMSHGRHVTSSDVRTGPEWFCDALDTANFIEKEGETWVVVDYQQYSDMHVLADRRAKDRDRKRRERQRKRELAQNRPADYASASQDVTKRPQMSRDVRTDKRREEYIILRDNASHDAQPGLSRDNTPVDASRDTGADMSRDIPPPVRKRAPRKPATPGGEVVAFWKQLLGLEAYDGRKVYRLVNAIVSQDITVETIKTTIEHAHKHPYRFSSGDEVTELTTMLSEGLFPVLSARAAKAVPPKPLTEEERKQKLEARLALSRERNANGFRRGAPGPA